MRTIYLHMHNTIQEKQIIWLMAGTFLAVVLLYGYFVNAAILNIVTRQHAAEELQGLQSVVADLESRYSTLRGEVTRERARALGFVEPKNQTFTSEKRLVRAQEVISN